MKKIRQKRQSFLKRLGITLVIPIFLMVIGSMMIFIPIWSWIGEAMSFSSLIFYDPSLEMTQTEFQINNQAMYLPKIGEEFATLKIPSANLEVGIYQGEGNAQLRQGVGQD